MKTTIGVLRKLIREALATAHDTALDTERAPAGNAQTVSAAADPRFSVAPPKGSMKLDSPALQKAKSVVKAIEKNGGKAEVNDVYQFIKNYEVDELVTKSTQEFVDEYEDSKNQGQTIRPGKPSLTEKNELGKYAFADHRRNCPEEPDNNLEKRLYRALSLYFSFNVPFLKNMPFMSISSSHVKLMQQFLANGEYNDVFKTPNVDVVYRGLAVDAETYAKFIDQQTFTYKSPKISSWSMKESVAWQSAKNASKKDKRGKIVLVAKVSDNANKFLSGHDGLYDVAGFSRYEYEAEVIGLGDIAVSSVLTNIPNYTMDDLMGKVK